MKKLFSIVTVLFVLVSTASVSAGDTNSTSLFSANELRLDAFGTYQSADAFGAGLGVTYFPWKNVGSTLWTGVDFSEGKFFENVNLGIIYRLPLTDVFAPYVTAGSSYGIDSSKFAPYVGAGVEYRITKKFGLFAEGTYGFGAWDNWELPDAKEVGVRAGVRFGF